MEIDEYDYNYELIWESFQKSTQNKSEDELLEYLPKLEHFRISNNYKEVYYWMVIISYYISNIESFNINEHESIINTIFSYLKLPNQNLKIYYGCFIFFLNYLQFSNDLTFIDENKQELLFNIFKCISETTSTTTTSTTTTTTTATTIEDSFNNLVITFLSIFIQEIPIKDDHLLKDQLMERICQIIIYHSKSFDLKNNYTKLWNSIIIYRYILSQFQKSETNKILKYYEEIKIILFRLFDLIENEIELVDLFYDVSSVIVLIPMVYDIKVCLSDLVLLAQHILKKHQSFKSISSSSSSKKIIDCNLGILCVIVKSLGSSSSSNHDNLIILEQLLPEVFSRFLELIKSNNEDGSGNSIDIKVQKLVFGYISKIFQQSNEDHNRDDNYQHHEDDEDDEIFLPINSNLIYKYCELIYQECSLAIMNINYKNNLIINSSTERDRNILINYATLIISTTLDVKVNLSQEQQQQQQQPPTMLFLDVFEKVLNSIQQDYNISTIHSKLIILIKMIENDYIVDPIKQYEAIKNLIKLIFIDKILKWDKDKFIKEKEEEEEIQQEEEVEEEIINIINEGIDEYNPIEYHDIFIGISELIMCIVSKFSNNETTTSDELIDLLLPIFLNTIPKLLSDTSKLGIISAISDLINLCSNQFYNDVNGRFTLVMELLLDYGFIRNSITNQSNDLYQMSSYTISLISINCNPILFKPFLNKILEIYNLQFFEKFKLSNFENLEFAKDNIISSIGSILKYQFENFFNNNNNNSTQDQQLYNNLIDIFISNIPILNDYDEFQNIIDTIIYLLLNHSERCLQNDQYLANILETICIAHEELNISIPLEDASKIIKIFNENKQIVMKAVSSLSKDHYIIIKSLFFKVNKFKK